MINFLAHNWLAHRINKNCVVFMLKYLKGTVLDIGCGNKPYEHIFQSNISEYIGLEHPNTLHKNNKIDIFGDACCLPIKNSTIDCVVSFQVMEHVAEPNQMLAEIYRVLKNDGVVAVTTPFMWGIHEAPHDYYRYTKYGLEYLFKKHGFEIIELKANTGYWSTAGLRFNYYLARFGKSFLYYILSPIFFCVQVISLIFDKIDREETDTASYTLIAKKP